jgi:hypothetical protein
VRLTHDQDKNSAYLWLGSGKPAERQNVWEAHTMGQFVLDFDKEHRLIGIEIVDPTKNLPRDLLAKADEGGPDAS